MNHWNCSASAECLHGVIAIEGIKDGSVKFMAQLATLDQRTVVAFFHNDPISTDVGRRMPQELSRLRLI